MADKPSIHSTYHFIDLYDDWSDYDYATKENVMDQMDRYNFATGNWNISFEEIENRTYDVLHALCTLNDEEIATIMVRHEKRMLNQ